MVSLIPRPGIANAKDGLILAEHAGDQYTYAAVLQWAGFAHSDCGELATAEDLFRKTLNIATERVSLVQSDFDAKPEYDISRLRQTEASLEQPRRGTELAVGGLSMLRREQPQEHFFGYSRALSYQLAGGPDEALATLIPALERAEQSSAGKELALMYRLKGRLLEGKSNTKEAEDSFRTSIEIARGQSAKSLELRATTSLARLLAKQGRRDEGRTMLSQIYNWFSEGFRHCRPEGRQGAARRIER